MPASRTSLIRTPGTTLIRKPFSEPIRRCVSLAVFEDTQEMLDIYVKRFGSLKGVVLLHKEVVTSVPQALAIFRETRPKIVITDLALNTECNSDGVAILKGIRKIAPATPVALSTTCLSDPDSELAEELRAAGFDRIFNKSDLAGMTLFILSRGRP